MKGQETRLIEFMEGSKKRFIIPVYQRNYNWKIENCKQIYDDLIKVVKYNRKNHFFGSIVSVYEPSGRNTELLIIDGQQRLTTISLMLLAMYNLLNEGIVTTKNLTLAKEIYEDFLVDKYDTSHSKLKLKPIKDDEVAFNKLLYEDEEKIENSSLTTNYLYFYERIKREEITIDELFEAICKLQIIRIDLGHDDNPQLVFESLNSTGLDLSEGDKIRNFVLMGLDKRKQEEYYEKYWNKIEKCTNFNVSTFIRDYLSIKTLNISPESNIYSNFKEYMLNLEIEHETLLKEMYTYAKRYEILIKANSALSRVNACIFRLNNLETTVTRPFLLEVLRIYSENKITDKEFEEIFLVVETYIFRRNICKYATNALNKIFLMLHREIYRLEDNEENYVEKLKYILLSKKDSSSLPRNEEFIQNFTERQVYNRHKIRVYILERFENFGIIEDKDIYRHIEDKTYSIEHIMPQHLTATWIKELGENYKEIHETWVHRIANLTLTGYNSSYSNSSFNDKKNMEYGFNQSGLRLNTYIATKDRWTLKEIEERNEFLMNRALEIWKLPETSYVVQKKDEEVYTLNDDTSMFKGRKVTSYTYKNVTVPVKKWVEMFSEVIRLIYDEEKEIINKAAIKDSNISFGSQFSYSKDSFIKSAEIVRDIYVNVVLSTEAKLNLLYKIFVEHNIDINELSFTVSDKIGI